MAEGDAVIGRVAVAVVPDATNFWREFQAKTDAQADKAGADAGRRYSRAFNAAAGDVKVGVDVDTAGVREKVAVATRDLHATVKVDADTKPAQRQLSLLKDGLVLALAGGPLLLGGGAAFAGVAAGAGLLAVALKAVQEQEKAGTPIGKEYAQHLAGLKDAYHGLQGAIATAIAPSAFQSIQILQDALKTNTPEIAHLAADAASAVSGLIRGVVGGFHNFAPLLDHVLLTGGSLAQKFADWASGPGGARFAHEMQTGFDQALPVIEHLATLVGKLFSASLPAGGGVLSAVDRLAIILNTFPTPVLTGIIAAFAAYRTFNAAAIAINGIKDAWSGLSKILGKLGIVGAAEAETTGVVAAKNAEAAGVIAANDRIIASNEAAALSFKTPPVGGTPGLPGGAPRGEPGGGGTTLERLLGKLAPIAALATGVAAVAYAFHELAVFTNPGNNQFELALDPFKGSTWSDSWHHLTQDVSDYWNNLKSLNDWWNNNANFFGTPNGSLGSVLPPGVKAQNAYNAAIPSATSWRGEGFGKIGLDTAAFNLQVANTSNKVNVLNREMKDLDNQKPSPQLDSADFGKSLGKMSLALQNTKTKVEVLNKSKANPFVDLNDAVFRQKVGASFGQMTSLGKALATPTVSANTAPFDSAIGGILGQIRSLGAGFTIPVYASFGGGLGGGLNASMATVGSGAAALPAAQIAPASDGGALAVLRSIDAKIGQQGAQFGQALQGTARTGALRGRTNLGSR